MYVGNNLGYYGGLEGIWGMGEAKVKAQPKIVDPKQYIPKKHDILNADQARLYLKSASAKKSEKTITQKKGGIYWTNTGPTYATKKLKTGRKAEKVPSPKLKFRPNVQVLRDLPKLNLPPIQEPILSPTKTSMQGLSQAPQSGQLSLGVLGLLIVGLVIYNRS